MSSKPRFAAHSPPKDQPEKWQTMEAHSKGVKRRAKCFGRAFQAETLTSLAAVVHDIGKYSIEFQQYLDDCHTAKLNHLFPPKPGSAEHKCAGTYFAFNYLSHPCKALLAVCVYGHHGGLHSPLKTDDAVKLQVTRRNSTGQAEFPSIIEIAQQNELHLAQVSSTMIDCPILERINALRDNQDEHRRALEMLFRFVFSSLVDADCLDTERHFSPEQAKLRRYGSLQKFAPQWMSLLSTAQSKLQTEGKKKAQGNSLQTSVLRVRNEVYNACVSAGNLPPGLFTLTVPTGGGKTRSSLAFALTHALAHMQYPQLQRSRIVYAIPFTSIVDQTVVDFRTLLGHQGILEHHSAIDVRHTENEDENQKQSEISREFQRRLVAENWSAALIVTTTVQLFESLFSNRTSACRKVHNLANAIIILDEVQTLPVKLLHPLLDGLKMLTEYFGATVVLCTATQPALAKKSPYGKLLPKAHPIITDPHPHFNVLRRVTYEYKSDSTMSWEQTAATMIQQKRSVMTILNTKKDALELYQYLPQSQTKHLSTLMCSLHRKSVLDEIKIALENERENGGKPIYLVATQVVEAGVNIDFPCVMRAIGPLDRIIQAGGRCNREGKNDPAKAKVIVFTPEEGTIPKDGAYQTAMSVARNMLRDENIQLDDPDVVTKYFEKFYGYLTEEAMGKNIQLERTKFNYPEVACKMKLIDNDTVPVLVPYVTDMERNGKQGKAAFDNLEDEIRFRVQRGWGLNRSLWQEIQPRSVAIYYHEVERRSGVLEELVPGQLYLWLTKYDPIVGIGNVVQLAPEDLITPDP